MTTHMYTHADTHSFPSACLVSSAVFVSVSLIRCLSSIANAPSPLWKCECNVMYHTSVTISSSKNECAGGFVVLLSLDCSVEKKAEKSPSLSDCGLVSKGMVVGRLEECCCSEESFDCICIKYKKKEQ